MTEELQIEITEKGEMARTISKFRLRSAQLVVRLCDALYEAGFRMQNAWISTEERLPKEDGEYLCLVNVPLRKSFYEVLSFAQKLSDADEYNFRGIDDAGFYAFDPEWGYYVVKHVTHWKPLPEPPSVEELANE